MRTLFITNMYPPHHYGGYELVCQEAVEGFRARGVECEVLTSDVQVEGAAGSGGSVRVRRDLSIYWDDHQLVTPRLDRRWAIERANQRALRAALGELRPDVVSVWAMGAMSLGLLTTLSRTGVPVVLVVGDDWLTYAVDIDAWSRLFRSFGDRRAALAERVLRVPCRAPDLAGVGLAAFQTGWLRDAAARSGVSPPSVLTYCGINTDHFPVDRKPPSRPAWNGRLLCVGRIDPRKGVATAIEALALLPPDTTLEVVGRGDERHLGELASLARRLGVGDRVGFSAAPRGELAARYASADCLVFPVTWPEPFGLVPIEAMACSTPVVATATGGSAEFLRDGVNCLHVPPGDAAGLARAVEALAADPELRSRLVAGGHRTAEELTSDRWITILHDLHLGAVAGFPEGFPADREPVEELP